MNGTIYIISGNGESADSSANGMQLESYELEAMLGDGVRVVRLAFDSSLSDEATKRRSDEGEILIVGHSFGGRTAIDLASKLVPSPVHLILLDPVRWEPGNTWAWLMPWWCDLPANVKTCIEYIRSFLIGPEHFHCRMADGTLVAEITLGGTDHVSIIAATASIVLDAAKKLFTTEITKHTEKDEKIFPPDMSIDQTG